MSKQRGLSFLNQAYSDIDRGDSQSAYANLNLAMREDPNIPEIYSEIALLEGVNGNIKDAIKYLLQAVTLRNDAKFWGNLCYWYNKDQNIRKAYTVLLVLKIAHPNYRNIYEAEKEITSHYFHLDSTIHEWHYRRASYILERLYEQIHIIPPQLDELDDLFDFSNLPLIETLQLPNQQQETQNDTVFISYKSDDNQVARYIAEILMLNKYDVWLAEYKITSKDYFPLKYINGKPVKEIDFSNSAVDDEIKNILRKAVGESTKAICLVNEKYANSEWCREQELKQILKSMDKNHITLIEMSKEEITHPDFPDLSGYKKYEWKNNYVALFDQLALDGVIVCPNLSMAGRKFHHGLNYIRFQEKDLLLDMSAWTKMPINKKLQKEYGSNQSAYLRNLGGEVFYFHQYCQQIDEKTAAFARQKLDDEEDISIFRRNLHDTTKYIEMSSDRYNSEIEIIGVHLYKILGHSQYAFTYRIKYASRFFGILSKGEERVCRKYIISLPDQNTGKEFEIAITVGILNNSSLEKFIKYVPIFDDLVNTLQYE